MIQKSINYIIKFIKDRLRTSITTIPLLVVVSILFKDYDKEISEVIGGNLISIKSYFSFACQFCIIQVNHFIFIKYEERAFGGKEFTCAVSKLLWKNEGMEVQMKKAIHEFVRVDFGIKTLSRIEEVMDEMVARRALEYAVGQIANSLQDCKMVQYYRDGYVTARKFIGGCISANIVSFSLCVYSHCTGQSFLLKISLVLQGIYIALLAVNMFLIKWFGRRYTVVLFEQYVYRASGKINGNKSE